MKFLFIIWIALLNNLNLYGQAFTVDVFDYNYSMAYSVHYHLTNKSVSVVKLVELKGEHPITLLKAKIGAANKQQILNLLTSFSFGSLKNEYKNDLVEDGDQKRIITQVNGRRKIIEIANVYNEVTAKLFEKINSTLKGELKIRYRE